MEFHVGIRNENGDIEDVIVYCPDMCAFIGKKGKSFSCTTTGYIETEYVYFNGKAIGI